MSKKLMLFPFGGNTREALIAIFAINNIQKEWEVLGFLDDDPEKAQQEAMGVKVIGTSDLIEKEKDAYILALPGNPQTFSARKNILDQWNLDPFRFAKILHPSVVCAPDAEIGYNTLLMSNVVVSANARIGNHCVLLPNTIISHDSVIEDYCSIGGNTVISGSVHVFESSYIGSGVRIRDNITIGRNTLVGLGTNVISSLDPNVVAVGNPARILRKREI